MIRGADAEGANHSENRGVTMRGIVGNGMKALGLGLSLLTTLVAPANAQTADGSSPTTDGGVQTLSAATDLTEYVSETEKCWDDFLKRNGWAENSLNEGDRIFVKGVATVNVPYGQAGWVESRIAAYEVAEMRAKAALALALGTEISSKRNFRLMENAAWNTGSVEEIKRYSQMDRILHKGADVMETELDTTLKQIDPQVDLTKYDRSEKLKTMESRFNRGVQSYASRVIAGGLPIKIVEGGDAKGYEVLVGLVWSPKLNRLAMNLLDKNYELPKGDASAAIEARKPKTAAAAVAAMGVQVVVNAQGQSALIAFGQAAPRNSAPAQSKAALQDALDAARNRARGSIANFIKEKVAFSDQETSGELTKEFADSDFGVQNIRNVERVISGYAKVPQIQGLFPYGQWVIKHPGTDQTIAVAAMVWSPDLAEKASLMDQATKSSESPRQPAQDGKDHTATGVKPMESNDPDPQGF